MVRTRNSRKKRGGDGDVIKGTLEYFLRQVKPSAEGNEALMNEKEVKEAYRQWHEYTAAEYKRRRSERGTGRSLVAGRRRRKTKKHRKKTKKHRKKTKKRRRKNKRKTKKRR